MIENKKEKSENRKSKGELIMGMQKSDPFTRYGVFARSKNHGTDDPDHQDRIWEWLEDEHERD
jgi:hypothetical protein